MAVNEPGPVRPGNSGSAPVAVRAGGGLVLRTGPTGREVLLVHRPRYDDWSFPKGKCDPGESLEDAAVREVEEETGLRCDLGPRLGETRYVDGRGRSKLVEYWLMDPPANGDATAEFVPNAEVDGLRWISVPGAATLLTYEHDRDLLGRLP